MPMTTKPACARRATSKRPSSRSPRPAPARNDPGYVFSRIQWLRRSDKVADAAHALLAAPREPERLVDPDQWWVERRVVARKLLDLEDFKLAYEVANGAATPA